MAPCIQQLNKVTVMWFVNDLHGRAELGSYSFSLWVRHFAVGYKLSRSFCPHHSCCNPLLGLNKHFGFICLLSSNWAMGRRWSHKKQSSRSNGTAINSTYQSVAFHPPVKRTKLPWHTLHVLCSKNDVIMCWCHCNTSISSPFLWRLWEETFSPPH